MAICLRFLLLVVTRTAEEKAAAGLGTEEQLDAPNRSIKRNLSTSMALCKQRNSNSICRYDRKVTAQFQGKQTFNVCEHLMT